MAVRPEAEVGRDLLIIWCVGGGERERGLQTVTLIHSQAPARPLIGHGPRVAASHWPDLSCLSVFVKASAWARACAAHWAQYPRSAGHQSHFRENSDEAL